MSIPGRGDQVYPFRAHSEYFYLTDRDEPGGVLAFDPVDGWTHFVADVTATGSFERLAVPLEAGASFTAGKPRVLFEGTDIFSATEGSAYDVSSDGRRFLMLKADQTSATEAISVILNWSDELLRRVPTC